MQFIFIRHGESAFNARNKQQPHTRVFSGQADIPLTQTGRRQAQALAKLPVMQTADAVYASPLSRAYETACLATTRKDIQLEPKIMERSLGLFNGKTETELHAHYPDLFAADEFKHSFTVKAPAGENYPEVIARVTSFLQHFDMQEERTILVFSHFVAIRLMLRVLLGLNDEQTFALHVNNCTPITVVGNKLGEFTYSN